MYYVATSQVVLHTPLGTRKSNFVHKVSLADAMARLLEVAGHWRQKALGKRRDVMRWQGMVYQRRR
jgi:hypothetical protein